MKTTNIWYFFIIINDHFERNNYRLEIQVFLSIHWTGTGMYVINTWVVCCVPNLVLLVVPTEFCRYPRVSAHISRIVIHFSITCGLVFIGRGAAGGEGLVHKHDCHVWYHYKLSLFVCIFKKAKQRGIWACQSKWSEWCFQQEIQRRVLGTSENYYHCPKGA